MERKKLTKEVIDRVRGREDFPISTDEDLIALSDAPYYTACPNPFLEEFVRENGKAYEEDDPYHREPFAADVSEGKSDPVYMAHNYHTKVPYKAIMRYLLHYTDPGDLILDGFCGSGMTGVAAQMCGQADPAFQAEIEQEMPGVRWGSRKAVLNDLSPAATFISYNQNTSVDAEDFQKEALGILKAFERDYGWMYATRHPGADHKEEGAEKEGRGFINYTVWSDVFICPHCSGEMVFTEVAFDYETKRVSETFRCPHCGRLLTKKDCSLAFETVYDSLLQKNIRKSAQKPVLINYTYDGEKYEKRPDEEDLAVIERTEREKIPCWIPLMRMPEGGETRRNDRTGITYLHHFYTRRNLIALSYLMDAAKRSSLSRKMRFVFEQVILGMSRIARYVPSHYSQVNQYLSGTLYIGSQIVEASPQYILQGKISKLTKLFSRFHPEEGNVCISTSSTTETGLPSDSIDYIFTDPPFGSNLAYSELNFFWEAWMRCITNNKQEAIVNPAAGKNLPEYQGLMEDCFREYYRVLKPNHWMTVEFHNSKNAVWNAIQQAIQRAGFLIADVRTLDKKQGTFKQINHSLAVKQDLVISAYKPARALERDMTVFAGTPETAWAFVRQHLSNLPVAVSDPEGKIDLLAERQAYLLFDRMVSYHILQGYAVPLDAAAFYRGLDEKFPKRDGMYFLPEQVTEYDLVRSAKEVDEGSALTSVTNEKSAISWLYHELGERNGGPKTYAELQPRFLREVKAVDRFEAMPELAVLLEENFLQDEKGRWYVPDVARESDLARLREKSLWKEFEGYLHTKGKLKLFRSEAIRAGFARLWKEKNYAAIVEMGKRLPEQTFEEDANLLMYYDISLSRV